MDFDKKCKHTNITLAMKNEFARHTTLTSNQANAMTTAANVKWLQNF